jgi:hypothetical protein
MYNNLIDLEAARIIFSLMNSQPLKGLCKSAFCNGG